MSDTKRERKGPPQQGPGQYYRNGITLKALFEMFPDDATAEQWFIDNRWPNGITCPDCGSDKNVKARTAHPTMPHRCNSCRKFFSVKHGTAMQSSKIGYQDWAIALYIVATGLKGTSSMKVHRDLGITQKSAWHLAHRIRQAFADNSDLFEGPVELDEAFFGGLEKNKHAKDRLRAGRGTVGKTAVAGARDHDTGQISAAVVPGTGKAVLHDFASARVAPEATVFTDEHLGHSGFPGRHAVRHNVGEYVNGQAHINGMESFWAMMKRGYHGTYHRMSPAHLQRYVSEFAGRHNQRSLDTEVQMRIMAQGLVGRRLRYKDLAVGRKRKDSHRAIAT